MLLLRLISSQCEGGLSQGEYYFSKDGTTFPIFCDHMTDGGAWITILNRYDGSLNFRTPLWSDYSSRGVGTLSGEFFLALNYIYLLTKDSPLELLVELHSGTDSAWAYYDSFSISDSTDKHRLSIGGYDPRSTAGDALSFHNGMQWSAPDQDNDATGRHCASILSSSFWFKACSQANPLGLYSVHGSPLANSWETWKSQTHLDSISFKIRQKRCASSSGQDCQACLTGYYLCTDPNSGRLDCCSSSISSCG